MEERLRAVLAMTGFCVVLLSIAPSPRIAAQGAMEDDQVPISFIQGLKPTTLKSNLAGIGGGVAGGSRRSHGSVLGIDSVVNFTSYFYEPGFLFFPTPQPGVFTWQYTMVGRAPFRRGDGDQHDDGTTWIPAPIVPVNVDLRNFDGSPRFVNGRRLLSSVAPYVDPVLKSPVFDKTVYSSSNRPTQFTDAVQRAEFSQVADDDWHTMLKPSVKTTRTMVLIRGTYAFALNADGTCCAFILVDDNAFEPALFPPTTDLSDTSTVMGAAEHANDIRTGDIATFLFPNTFLYFGSPERCCALAFHAFDVAQGDAANGFRERRFVMNYSSWTSRGLFALYEDVLPLSHEMAEIFNDPFLDNLTPWWQDPSGLVCKNLLETGDVIEFLPNLKFPITMNGFTYHVQNEALLQWFAGQTPSTAIDHAYSYPDTTVLTSANVLRKPQCVP